MLYTGWHPAREPVIWTLNNDAYYQIDETGYLSKREFDEKHTRSHNVIVTATLPDGRSASARVSGGGEIIKVDRDKTEKMTIFRIAVPEPYKSDCDIVSVPLSDGSLDIGFNAEFCQKLRPEDIDIWGTGYSYYAYSDDSEIEVKWTSDNPEVATVDEKGIVTLHSNGRALIKAVAKDKYRGTLYTDRAFFDFVCVDVE